MADTTTSTTTTTTTSTPFPDKTYGNETDYYKKNLGKEEGAPKWKEISKNKEDERTKQTNEGYKTWLAGYRAEVKAWEAANPEAAKERKKNAKVETNKGMKRDASAISELDDGERHMLAKLAFEGWAEEKKRFKAETERHEATKLNYSKIFKTLRGEE